MKEAVYEIEVLLKDPKNKIFAVVFYVHILLDEKEICKVPLEFEILTADMYYATYEYDIFIKSWELNRMNSTKKYVELLVNFYQNVEGLKLKSDKM